MTTASLAEIPAPEPEMPDRIVRPMASYRVLFGGIFVIAFATLLFEVSLIRVLSFTIWHHFGYVVISTALLGLAAAGSFLAVFPRLGKKDLRAVLAGASLLSALAVVATLGFICAAPLDPMDILTVRSQAVLFIGYQIAAAIPFFFSGLTVSLAMREAAGRVDRLYFWDLIGAALGCGSAVMLMNRLSPPGAAVGAAAAFAGAAAIFAAKPGRRIAAAALCVGLLAASTIAARMPFQPAASKELALQEAFGWVPRFTRWTGLFRTDVVEQAKQPPTPGGCRDWGASPLAPGDCPRPRVSIAHDATAGAPMYVLRDHDDLSYLDYHVLRVPYLISTAAPRVLVIGVGGGRDLIMAERNGASSMVGVELDPVTIDVIHDVMNDLFEGFFRRPNIRLVAGDGRHFVRTTDETFDIIQITGVDTLSALFSGAYVLAENYLYTVEAFEEYLDHLRPGGVLSIGSAELDRNAPRASARMVSVAEAALRARGIEDPGRHIAVIDSGKLAVEVLVRNEPFDAGQVERLADHAARMQFPVLWLPGGDANPIFRELATATGAEREQLLRRLPFLVGATTDDDPFFFFFFRWSGLWKPGTPSPGHATALGQIVLGALLVSLSLLSVLFVLGPLLVLRRRDGGLIGRDAFGILGYFLAIGVGFMLFEVSFIQRFVLFLGYPTYSLTVTLFSLLSFLGCGSFLSRRWVGRERVVLPVALCLITGLVIFYIEGLPAVQARFLGSSLSLRAALTAAFIAPLGLVLGVFLPLGIRRAAAVHADLVPWAWGINGCASVTGGILAVVLAMSFGFRRVWLLSILIYTLGVVALLALGSRRTLPSAAGGHEAA